MPASGDSLQMTPARSTRLGRFLLLSLGAHVLAAAIWLTPVARPLGQLQQSLAVVLAPERVPSASAPSPVATELPRQRDATTPAERKGTPLPKAAAAATPDTIAAVNRSAAPPGKPAEMEATANAASPSTTATPQQVSDADTASTAASLAARINLDLARHFHYPPQALRRGWQGIVLLGFRVGIDGSIDSIHIAQSSGHALLDRAALGALSKVHKVALDSGLLRAALDLQLPVVYRLEES